MFPASFYQQLPVYRAPSPDHHRRAQPFTIAPIDSYDLFCTPSPQAYATAEASALDHLHRQAALEAHRSRERELEKQRRLARLAALEEAQHRAYHQQQVFDAYLQAQARARAEAEAERLQRERQRQYQERAAAIARAQAVQREKAERARAAEIERRREEARQRIFVRDLMDSLFADVPRELEASSARRPVPQAPQQHAQQQRIVQPQQAQPQVLQPPTAYRVAQPYAAQPRAVQPQHAQPQVPRQIVQPQTQARVPHQAQPQRPAAQAARQPSPDSDQEAFERFLNSFFGVASPQISKPRGPVAESKPSAPTQALPTQEAKPRPEATKPVTQPEPTKPKALEQPVTQPQPAKAASTEQADELTNLLSTIFGVPVNVKNVQLKNNAASPPIVKASTPAETESRSPVPVKASETQGAASPVVRPGSPTPEKQPASRDIKSPSVSQPDDGELTEDFKQMVDKVFKDLERVFGVQPTEESAPEQKGDEGKKEEAQSAQSSTSVPETAKKVEEKTVKPESTPQSTKPSGIETPSEAVDLPAPVATAASDQPAAPAAAPIPDTLEEPSEEQSTEISTEILDDDDVPSSAAELQDKKAASAATLIQQKYRKHHARVQRLEKLESLKAKLDKISKGFTFPEHLDFQDPDSEQPTPSLDPVDGASHDGDERVTPVPPLSFTHNNAPYHAHAQALLSLLVAADAISSDGDKDVRSVRKAFVKEVEEKLAEMERQRSAVYRRQQAEQGSAAAGENVAKADPTTTQGEKVSTPTAGSSATNAQTSDNVASQDANSSVSESAHVPPSGEDKDSQPTAKDSPTEPTSQATKTAKTTEDAPEVPLTAEAVVVTDEDVLTAPIVPETPSESAPAKFNAPPRPSVEDEQESTRPSNQTQNDDFVIVEK